MAETKQKDIWYNEHLTAQTLPSVAENVPSDSVTDFVEWLRAVQLPSCPKVIDIGCGKGRNSVYLAQQGFEVYAVDFIQHAIETAKSKADEQGVSGKINFITGNIDKKWQFPDNFFDLAVDCFSSIDIDTKLGRDIYKSEMHRTLKSGGYALVCVVAAHDEWEKELIAKCPGAEKNSSIWPQNGKFQKNYDLHELKNFYREFLLIECREYQKKAVKLGKEFTATNFWLLLRKP